MRIEEVPGKPNCRVFCFKDETKYFGKNTLCPKRKAVGRLGNDINPLWIVNEFTYSHIARKSQLRMPLSDKFEYEGEWYFISEMLDHRTPLKGRKRLGDLFNDNREQLTKGILLDLALLNSDRTCGNILCDDQGLIWFYDHDKSLWGDGRSSETDAYGKQGDIDRYNPIGLREGFERFLGDYINARFYDANALVFNNQEWLEIRDTFESLSLDIASIEESRSLLPNESWLSDELHLLMKEFLRNWWGQLRLFFSDSSNRTKLIQILSMRYKQYWVEKCRKNSRKSVCKF